jgi:hypothetical protein
MTRSAISDCLHPKVHTVIRAKNINIVFFITTIFIKQAKDKKIDITLDAH